MTTAVEVPATLPELVRIVVPHLREVFGPNLAECQTLALAEEAGEFIGAYRRWSDQARRNGPWQDVCDELADVLITAYVTAEVFDLDVVEQVKPNGIGANEMGRALFTAVGDFLDAYDRGESAANMSHDLSRVVALVHLLAAQLNIDLGTAWRAKAERILTRGWKERKTCSR
jgi:NTP pyrophosphatase (non-canonical NTP hydrolase)